MSTSDTQQDTRYQLQPIGFVRGTELDAQLEILEPYRPALKQLNHYSHVIALWWAHEHDNPHSREVTQCKPPYAADKLTGVFACRSEYRPNPIAITVCEIQDVDEECGIVRVTYMDAWDGTPLLDLKAYYPVTDRVRDVRIPDWLSGWPEWVEDAHLLAF